MPWMPVHNCKKPVLVCRVLCSITTWSMYCWCYACFSNLHVLFYLVSPSLLVVIFFIAQCNPIICMMIKEDNKVSVFCILYSVPSFFFTFINKLIWFLTVFNILFQLGALTLLGAGLVYHTSWEKNISKFVFENSWFQIAEAFQSLLGDGRSAMVVNKSGTCWATIVISSLFLWNQQKKCNG